MALDDFTVRYNDEMKSCRLTPEMPPAHHHHHHRPRSSTGLIQANVKPRSPVTEDLSIRFQQEKLSETWDPFLRRYNLSVSQLLDLLKTQGEGEVHATAIADSLRKYKATNLMNTLPSLGSTSMSTLTSYLVSLDSSNQLISDALFKDAEFEPTLINEQQHAMLTQLDQELEKVRKALDGLCLDSLYGKDLKREKFLERWAGERGGGRGGN